MRALVCETIGELRGMRAQIAETAGRTWTGKTAHVSAGGAVVAAAVAATTTVPATVPALSESKVGQTEQSRRAKGRQKRNTSHNAPSLD
jgi:hypothetical protein